MTPSGTGQVAGHPVATLLLAALATLATLAAVVLPGVPVAATGQSAAGGDGQRLPARLILDSLTPAVPRPGGDLTVTGRVQNAGAEDLSDLSVRLRVSDSRVASRGELARLAAGEQIREGSAVGAGGARLPDLAPGETTPFRLTVALDSLALEQFGVYPIAVEARGSRFTGFGRVGLTPTFLPWAPDPLHVEPLRLVWLWQLADRPRRRADGAFLDDTLAEALGAGGRLSRLVEVAAGHRLTWVIDPMLLEDAADMADGYRVVVAEPGSDGEPTVPGAGDEAARTFLERLRAGIAGGQVVPLPYGDLDVVAARRHGLRELVARTRQRGEEVARAVLGVPVDGGVAVPPGGWVDEPTAALLRDTGMTAVVLAGGSLRPSGLTYTPTGRASLSLDGGAPVPAVLFDERLSDVVTANTSRAGTRVLATQRFLAETAMVTAERPGVPRTVAVAPPRHWSVARDHAAALLDLTEQAPWMAPAVLDDLLAVPPPDVARESLSYPPAALEAELAGDYLSGVRAVDRTTVAVAEVLSEPAALTTPYRRQQERLVSAGLRESDSLRTQLREATREGLARTLDAVRVLPTTVQLPSRRESFPVTVVNDFDQPVNVRLTLYSESPRLSVGTTETQTIAAGGKKQVPVTATAVAGGVVTVQARLSSPDGTPFGSPVEIRVQVSQYGLVALLVTGGAALLLFSAAARNIVRRVRAARRENLRGRWVHDGAGPQDGEAVAGIPVHPLDRMGSEGEAAGDRVSAGPRGPRSRPGPTRGRHVG